MAGLRPKQMDRAKAGKSWPFKVRGFNGLGSSSRKLPCCWHILAVVVVVLGQYGTEAENVQAENIQSHTASDLIALGAITCVAARDRTGLFPPFQAGAARPTKLRPLNLSPTHYSADSKAALCP